MSDPRALMMWTVYRPGPPYPRNYVAREFEITAAGPRLTGAHLIGSLERVRDYLTGQLALTRLGRSPDDDPTIVETWV